MKRIIAGCLAGAVLAGAGVAGAMSTRVVRVKPGDQVRFAGLQCSANTTTSSYFNCVGPGKYGVLFGTKEVLVIKFLANGKYKTVFTGTQ